MEIGFGVDLGGTTVKIAVFRETGELLSKWEIPTVTKNNGAQILPDSYPAMTFFLLPAGAFMTLGLIIAVVQKVRNTVEEKKRLAELHEIRQRLAPLKRNEVEDVKTEEGTV